MTAPPAWLIGTNAVSEMMRPRPEPRVAAYLVSIAGDGIGLVVVTRSARDFRKTVVPWAFAPP